jgi:hypothetical protein
MAKSTMHQAKAIATQSFSCLPAGRHQTPCGGTTPEWNSMAGLLTVAFRRAG